CGWAYSSIRTLELAPGQELTMHTGEEELLVLPLAGACTVLVDGQELALHGRPDVFSRVTDFAYVPRDASVTVRSAAGGRFALPGARADRRLPARYGPAENVAVEVRGAGQASRQVNNFCSPEAFETDRLVSVEVLTPAGNWSSYPPHKHDECRPGEAELEEIYYFEVGRGPAGAGFGYQRVYRSAPSQPIDVLAEVRTGDVVLVPNGYHGPSMAAPGYDLYYLNVLAGPAEERSMAFCDDPAHAWIRDTWAGQPTDPRLPMCSHEEGR
ncbi:MAG: 5-deoxy-glucuronate isomerase, partial [Actinomycetota bacterium]